MKIVRESANTECVEAAFLIYVFLILDSRFRAPAFLTETNYRYFLRYARRYSLVYDSETPFSRGGGARYAVIIIRISLSVTPMIFINRVSPRAERMLLLSNLVSSYRDKTDDARPGDENDDDTWGQRRRRRTRRQQ